MENKIIQFNTQIWKEGDMYVSYAPQLDVSSCGKTVDEAKKNIKEAVSLFFSKPKKWALLIKSRMKQAFQNSKRPK